MQDYHDQQHIPEEQQIEEKPRKSRMRRFFGLLVIFGILSGFVVLFAFKTGFTFSQISISLENGGGRLPVDQPIKEKDPDRINVLLLGLRGEGDPHGGLLTDSMLLISVKKSTGQVALISIPRDLYVTIPGAERKDKINAVYAFGEEKKWGGGGLVYSKAVVSEVTGLFIDYAASVDFAAFQEVIDAIGGIDIYLEKPFIENKQFTNEIELNLPAGKNHLDGKTALFYVRSRYTTSDFDRMRRQQQVLVAVKDRVLSIGVLGNPLKVFNLLDILGRHVRTDAGMNEMQEMLRLASGIKAESIIKRIFDTTPEGLLYSSYAENGAYILLPVNGNYDKIREVCRNIFE